MKINKKVVKVSGIVLAGALVFGGGLFSQQVYTKATTDWKTDAINTANANLGSAGYSEKEKLKAQASTDINSKVQDEINQSVEDQKAELQKLLDEYYQMKLNNMTSTPEFLSLQQQIKQIQANILARYETEIDQVFAAQTSGQ
jgi:cell shape-determining protein MreC